MGNQPRGGGACCPNQLLQMGGRTRRDKGKVTQALGELAGWLSGRRFAGG